MIDKQIATYLFLSLWAVGAWAALIHAIPATFLSLYRYKLWDIRDSIASDLRLNKLPETRVTRDLLESTEDLLLDAEEVSFLNVITWGLFSEIASLEEHELQAEIDALSGDMRKRYETYEDRIARATALRLLIGTPSGWIGVVTIPLWLPLVLYRLREPISRHRAHLFSYGKRRASRKFLQRLSELVAQSPNARDGLSAVAG